MKKYLLLILFAGCAYADQEAASQRVTSIFRSLFDDLHDHSRHPEFGELYA